MRGMAGLAGGGDWRRAASKSTEPAGFVSVHFHATVGCEIALVVTCEKLQFSCLRVYFVQRGLENSSRIWFPAKDTTKKQLPKI